MSTPRRPDLTFLLTIVALLVLATFLVPHLAGSRLRDLAARRGFEASWGQMRLVWPPGLTIRDLRLVQQSSGDTTFVADSVGASLHLPSLLVLRPRLASVGIAHAVARLPGRAAADTAEALEPPMDRRSNPARAARLRHSAESVVRLLAAPARRLPRTTLRDVTLLAPAGGDVLWSGVRLGWLDLQPSEAAVRLRAAGVLDGERPLPFEASLRYGRDDRITGGGRVLFPGDGGAGAVRVSIDGALHQDRRAGVVTLHDSTRLRLGELPFTAGLRLERAGPRLRLRLRGGPFTEARVRASVPAELLGALANVGVRGSWEYALGLDLDLARPDSVAFTADVIPHGLTLDPGRTRLRLLGLGEPFTAAIHLPRGRVVPRLLSPENPHYRPLGAIAPALVQAVLTNEDGGFFRHRGFNTEAVRGAIAENLKAGAFRRGAGTITMQLARNLYLGHDRTLSRKFREVVLAWILEHLTGTSKERLLEIYLNIIEWGPNVHGVSEAAGYYFECDAGALTVDQALFLATVIPSPVRWRQRFDRDGALRPFVRAQMHFIGRAMIARGWLEPGALPAAESLRVELRGAAQAVFRPDTSEVAVDPDRRPD